jgi:hypothetical protein
LSKGIAHGIRGFDRLSPNGLDLFRVSLDHIDYIQPDRLARCEPAMAALPADAVAAFIAQLNVISGLEAEYRELPGLAHGPMLSASLSYALYRMTVNG